MDDHTPDKQALKRAARLLGMMAARTPLGDSYDVLEEFAEGWAYVISGAEQDDNSAPYTSLVKSPAGPAVGAEAILSSDQAAPAPTTAEQLRLQLAILADLRAAVESVIEWRVDDARAARMSWADIAEPLDITKQGAHKRYMVDRIRPNGAPKV